MRAALALGACWALAIACGGAKMAAPPRAAEPASRDPHAEIEALDRAIADDMARAHMEKFADLVCSGAACPPVNEPVSPADDPSCRPAPSESCKTTCTLASSICDNQKKICELARQLPGDKWAADKCDNARSSCHSAHDACCSCML